MVNYPLGGDIEYRDPSEVIVLVLHPRLLPSLLLSCVIWTGFPLKDMVMALS